MVALRVTLQLYALSLATSAPAAEIYDHIGKMDQHLTELMDYFADSGPRLIPTFSSLPGPIGESVHCPSAGYAPSYGSPVSDMADLYDNSIAAIYFIERGMVERAHDICDVFVKLESRGIPGVCDSGGCTQASVASSDLNNFTTWKYGEQVYVGNMAWEGLALLRCHAVAPFGVGKYLDSAEHLVKWMYENTWNDTFAQGFTMGYDYDDKKAEFKPVYRRSTEHNIDMYALLRNLHELTGNKLYLDGMNHALSYLEGMVNLDEAYLMLGTLPDGQTINVYQPRPSDCQTWSTLARVPLSSLSPTVRLEWVSKNTLLSSFNDEVVCEGHNPSMKFSGTSFSKGLFIGKTQGMAHEGDVCGVLEQTDEETCGEACLNNTKCVGATFDDTGFCQLQTDVSKLSANPNATLLEKMDSAGAIQNEINAGAGMAFKIAGVLDTAKLIWRGLRDQQQYAPVGGMCSPQPGIPTGGMPATPSQESADSGYGYCYPNAYHVASSSWTGLAFLDFESKSKYPNPYDYFPPKPVASE